MTIDEFARLWPGSDPAEFAAVLAGSSGKGRTHEDEITRRWYASLPDSPAFDIYNDPAYAPYVWSSWRQQSRYRIGRLAVLRQMGWFEDVQSLVDLGCGAGLSTIALAKLWPGVAPVGTNVEGTQAAIARLLGVTVLAHPPRSDLVFASDYFEHFERPVEHLVDVLDATQPRYLVVGNAFGARSPGHFITFWHGSQPLGAKAIGRLFGAVLRSQGWRRERPVCIWNTGLWVR